MKQENHGTVGPVATWPKPPSDSTQSVAGLRFGAFEVDLGTKELRKNGVLVKLQEQPYQILELLVTRASEVMARSMVLRYKGGDLDPQDAGRELRVGAVLTGRIVQRGCNLAFDAELVDVGNGWRLWGDRYVLEASGLAAQEGISKTISEGLRARLTGTSLP